MSDSPLFLELVLKARTELEFLPDKQEEDPESTIAALWCFAAGMPVSVERAMGSELPMLSAMQQEVLLGLFERRRSGVPLQHITGRQRFVDLELLAGPEALIPRRETEILATAAMGIANRLGKDRITILDVCTGAGNIACLLAHHFPNAFVYASDLSADAVELAERNARFLHLEDRMEFRCGDLLQPFDETRYHAAIDLLTCNPPYISSGRIETMSTQIVNHEPRMAFDGGPFGVKILQSLIREAPRFIRPGGWLAFETGLGQGEVMKRRLEKRGFSGVETFSDSRNSVRVLSGMIPCERLGSEDGERKDCTCAT